MKYTVLFFLIPFFCLGQQTSTVDFITCDAAVSVDFSTRKVTGNVTYVFDVLSKTDTIKIDAVKMSFLNLTINGKKAGFKTSDKTLDLYKGFKKGKNTLTFEYSATPKQTIYFFGEAQNEQIWTQGQGKDTSHWLPSFNDVNEKVVFNISVSYDKDFTLISNGTLNGCNQSGQIKTCHFKMRHPMSSYLVMLTIGKFDNLNDTAASGTKLIQFISSEDSLKMEPTYRNSTRIFNFFENEIGVAYPWETYKQVPVKDFLYAGMENTSATVFSQDFVVDQIGYTDKSYLNVNAHELAHQWFGDMVTAKSGKHHWLQEGFATYYALLAERAVLGDDHYYHQLYNYAEELQHASKTDTIPILNAKASSLTFYRKGAWALHVLREAIGAENFRKTVKNYLEKYAFKNVDTDNFLAEVKKVTNYDVDGFRKRWLESPGFEVREAISMLKNNESMRLLFAILDLTDKPLTEKRELFETTLKSSVYYPIKQEIVYQLQNVAFDEKAALINLAMQSGEVKVRQSVAQTIGKFPESFADDYAALLDDKSYLTQEIAMAVLWKQFPEKRSELLEKTKGRVGFNDKNLRIQWLAMALSEKSYAPSQKVAYYDELLVYSTPRYESSVRRNAIENLIFLAPNDTNALNALVNPLVHHQWQFSKFAREKIREFIKYIPPRRYYEKLLPDLPENERAQLKRLLDENRPLDQK